MEKYTFDLIKYLMAALASKLKDMLWDIPPERRSELVDQILSDPAGTFQKDETLFVRALNSLKWYELISLTGTGNLAGLLTDSAIQRLFPPKRRTYYTNARRLLYKYGLSSAE